MNMNELAKRVTKVEGGKVNLSIAQVKEVLRVLATEMANDTKAFEAFINYFLKILGKRKREVLKGKK